MRLKVTDWFVHKAREVIFPDRGLTVVQGANGSGKSSLFVEAFSAGLFGSTARGTTPKPPYTIEVDIGTLSLKRENPKSAARVSWAVDGVSQGVSEGATKATKRVIEFLGLDAEAWNRTHVCSAEKIARFSGARDSERKALLESLLGLSDFDAALKAVRDQKKEKQLQLRDAEAALSTARVLLNSYVGDLAAAERRLDELSTGAQSVEELRAELDEIKADKAATAELTARVESRRDACNNKYNTAREARAAATAAVASASRAVVDTKCGACGREYDDDVDHAALHETLKMAKAVRGEVVLACDLAEEALKALDEEARRGRRESEKYATRETELTRALGLAQRRADVGATVASARVRVSEAEMDVIEASGEPASLQFEMGVIKGAEDILGLRGARSRVLTDALTQLEAGANAALNVMGVGSRLKLAATSDKVSGGVSDTISIEIDNWGGGDGYDGASGGERKRADLALLTGLSCLYAAPAALGVQLPMIFDDIFDTLDASGIVEVSRLIDTLARDRAVIVITQNEDLAAALSPNTSKTFRL